MKNIVIALDGYSACGKSTTARIVANRLGYIFIDSGAMYRAVSLYFLRHQVDYDKDGLQEELSKIHLKFQMTEEDNFPQLFMNEENVEKEIRGMEVASIVSEVSAIKEVRETLVEQQQQMGREKGIVMDGRDIGTVVFPNAELKIFMNASLEKRIERRKQELKLKGQALSDEVIRKNILHRDHIDTTREESPLHKANDAIELDTTELTIEQQVEFVLNLAKEKIGSTEVNS